MSVFETRISVRTYELDMLGHVNNAVYLNWLEEARLAAMQACGYEVRSLSQDWLTNIVRAEIDFRTPTFYGDEILVTTELEAVGRTSFTLQSEILKLPGRQVVATCRAVLVWLDLGGRPSPVPPELEGRWRRVETASPGSVPVPEEE